MRDSLDAQRALMPIDPIATSEIEEVIFSLRGECTGAQALEACENRTVPKRCQWF